ncbi:MAG: WD40/YVTN/BNR-like repeat-containing protein, partial [Chitinophagia bacterium]
MIKNRLTRMAVLMLLFVHPSSFAQTIRNNAGNGRVASFKLHESLRLASPYQKMQWRNVGPDLISGRVTEVAGIPGNKNIIYASFATGGFWKTMDAGEHWMPLTDKLGTLSIGAFALAPSNPDIIYLGTGEANI